MIDFAADHSAGGPEITWPVVGFVGVFMAAVVLVIFILAKYM